MLFGVTVSASVDCIVSQNALGGHGISHFGNRKLTSGTLTALLDLLLRLTSYTFFFLFFFIYNYFFSVIQTFYLNLHNSYKLNTLFKYFSPINCFMLISIFGISLFFFNNNNHFFVTGKLNFYGSNFKIRK